MFDVTWREKYTAMIFYVPHKWSQFLWVSFGALFNVTVDIIQVSIVSGGKIDKLGKMERLTYDTEVQKIKVTA